MIYQSFLLKRIKSTKNVYIAVQLFTVHGTLCLLQYIVHCTLYYTVYFIAVQCTLYSKIY